MSDVPPPHLKKYLDQVVKWSRRITAILVSVLLLRWLFLDATPTQQLQDFLAPLLVHLKPVPVHRSLIALVTIWYAFLSQLKIRWALWLPFYLALLPPAWIVWTILKLVSAPLLTQMKSFGEAGTVPKESTGTARTVPTKRIWLTLFFLWLVAFRGLEVSWAVWIPPFLALPIWFFFIRLAYQLAMTPRTFATILVTLCGTTLDTQIKTFNDAKDKKAAWKIVKYVCGIVNGILQRYSEERILSIVQRESMALFSVALLAALVVSSWFWGLVALAVRHTDHRLLDAYNFFNSGSLTEAVLWAWGCMTTSINFPGRLAPTWLKFLHGSILLTGLFQLTFLLACFAVMASSESQRTVEEARKLLRSAQEKLEQTRALEAMVIEVDVTEVKSPPGDPRS